MRSEYFLRVRAVVNKVDPIGLIELGCRADEYDPEVEDLVKWRHHLDADGLTDVFVRWFGEEGRMERWQAEAIAAAVNQIRPS